MFSLNSKSSLKIILWKKKNHSSSFFLPFLHFVSIFVAVITCFHTIPCFSHPFHQFFYDSFPIFTFTIYL